VVYKVAPAKACLGKELLGQPQWLLLLFLPSWGESQTIQDFIENRARNGGRMK